MRNLEHSPLKDRLSVLIANYIAMPAISASGFRLASVHNQKHTLFLKSSTRPVPNQFGLILVTCPHLGVVPLAYTAAGEFPCTAAPAPQAQPQVGKFWLAARGAEGKLILAVLQSSCSQSLWIIHILKGDEILGTRICISHYNGRCQACKARMPKLRIWNMC